MKRRPFYCLIGISLLLWASPLLLRGQTAQITGLVTDTSGASVPGASITAKNLATGIENNTTTNARGNFAIPQLNPGSYSLTASKKRNCLHREYCGIASVIGTWGEGGVGQAAVLHLVASSRNFEHASDSTIGLTTDSFITEPFTFDSRACLSVPHKPGLGVELDDATVLSSSNGTEGFRLIINTPLATTEESRSVPIRFLLGFPVWAYTSLRTRL